MVNPLPDEVHDIENEHFIFVHAGFQMVIEAIIGSEQFGTQRCHCALIVGCPVHHRITHIEKILVYVLH